MPDPQLLLAWYDAHARVLPWRADRKDPTRWPPNPYHVWLSEMMLQQTTVMTALPYFLKFIQKWPTLPDLAAATEEEIRQQWAGLGYYRRARHVYACAQQVMTVYGGVFPSTEAELLHLDGIGPYTAAAVAAIAFDQKTTVVDGNVERVMARLHKLETTGPALKRDVTRLATPLVPETRRGDYAQALMDLGATICTPRSPACDACPWQQACRAAQAGTPELYPQRLAKKQKPKRQAYAFVLFDTTAQSVWLRQRPRDGLLAEMMEVPTTPWTDGPLMPLTQALAYAPAALADWRRVEGRVRHIFTHFDLEIEALVAANCATVEKEMSQSNVHGRWVLIKNVKDEALPSLMHKILRLAVKERGHAT